MDVRLVKGGVVTDHPVEDLAEMLWCDDGLVWVDIPECDPVATQALAEVFGSTPMRFATLPSATGCRSCMPIRVRRVAWPGAR